MTSDAPVTWRHTHLWHDITLTRDMTSHSPVTWRHTHLWHDVTLTCDMTSHGSLTIDCLPENGVGATETKACHQFSCTPTGMLHMPYASHAICSLASCLNYAWKLQYSCRPRPDSWLVCCPFGCHREWRHEWQHGGLCPCRRSFGCVLLLDQIFRKQCTVRQYTTLIYLINMHGKFVLVLGLDSELHYFSIFTENKKNEHLIFCECHGR